MSVQRRRGQPALVWVTEEVEDRRGNVVKRPTAEPRPVTVWQIPQRSARAEVPGQQQINVVRIGLSETDAEGVDLWSRVQWNGRLWDVVTPPAYHHGTRHVRHYSLDIRERPEAADG